MIPRYQTPEMNIIWSDEARLQTWFQVELSALAVFEKRGFAPRGTFEELQEKSKNIDWTWLARRANEIEQTTQHDVIAFLTALEEVLGENSRFLHLGMTSSDVVDTAFAKALQKSGEQILKRLSVLTKELSSKALEYKNTPCLGRTHGQAAEVTTFGLKLLSFVSEMKRHEERLTESIKDISFGKISGAVGNYGNVDPEIEALVMKDLGLLPEPVSTQVVPRDRHALFFSTLAVIAGGLERLAIEIRHLMRSEVAEAFEPFKKGQKGSSAMPHKRNPILTENITGLCRLIRGYAQSAMENQALWHERDISHSSVERVIGPDATTLLDFAISRMTRVISGLEVDKNQMQKNIERSGGFIFSESILLQLIQKGILRQKAYEWVQRAAMQSREQGSFLENLKQDPDIQKHLSAHEIDQAFDLTHHIRWVDDIFKRVL